MTEHFGSCLCSTVKFSVHGDFDSFYLCHCRFCQKDTGSAHAANLFSQTAKLYWLSGSEAVTSYSLPGTRHSKSFCKLCGSALPGETDGLLVVPAGSLDSEFHMLPSAHIFMSTRSTWEDELKDAPKFEKLPD
ncbi:hypothetical protein TDB9533_01103 [Thalassocella blandensis]|nr:hypothetical protein TDB9533_01103 [Thalassocella blandensis]